MQMGKVTTDQLENLFVMTLELLTEKVKDRTATPTDIRTITQLLKDNNIEAVDELLEALGGTVQESLPDLPDMMLN